MKKLIYISGGAFASITWIGSFFKLLHYPGASILLIIGILGLISIFLPVALINKYQSEKTKKWLYISLFVSVFITFLSALFKIMHWPGASILLIFAVPLPFLFFLPVYMYHTLKENNKSLNSFMLGTLLVILISIMSSLIAVSVSFDVKNGLYNIYKAKQDNLKMTEIQTNDSSDVFTVNTFELNKYFEDLKIELIGFLTDEPEKIMKDGNIDIDALKMIGDSDRAYKFFEGDDNKLEKIAIKVEVFLNDVEKNSNLTDEEKTIVYQMLTSTKEAKIPDYWQTSFFDNKTLITSLNTISQIQEGISFAYFANNN